MNSGVTLTFERSTNTLCHFTFDSVGDFCFRLRLGLSQLPGRVFQTCSQPAARTDVPCSEIRVKVIIFKYWRFAASRAAAAYALLQAFQTSSCGISGRTQSRFTSTTVL